MPKDLKSINTDQSVMYLFIQELQVYEIEVWWRGVVAKAGLQTLL